MLPSPRSVVSREVSTYEGVLTLGGTQPASVTDAAALAVPEAYREQWEERAAIIEWDGHMPRVAAERLAWAMFPHQLQQK